MPSWCSATLIDVDFMETELKGVKFAAYMCGAILIRVGFQHATLNDVMFNCTTLEKVSFIVAKMDAKNEIMYFGNAKCVDCNFLLAHVTGMLNVQGARFAPIDVPKR